MGATEDAARRGPAHPRLCGRGPSFSCLDDLRQSPALRLRERTRLDDADNIPRLGLVLLVVRVELLRAANDLLVARVRLHDVDADDDRLVHRRRDDDAAALLTPAALVFGLRQPGDRLPLGRLLPLGLRTLATLRTRDALPLRLGRDEGYRLLLGGGLP